MFRDDPKQEMKTDSELKIESLTREQQDLVKKIFNQNHLLDGLDKGTM
jgi:hypothetical protein